ncbi:helix-turn-helix domain-containing protein [Flammeovirga yaeyamensis]|uniref:Helix-turn-helix domain-containing protein n=1 Tax=Flammeovirga yaeyamensis TaxID=367791 RepID=A0AAX1N9K9_9BACT|nr:MULTISPECIES: helix-turn-helix domain-containing protein [Flammeovirga]ANQ51986.2 helix-turn-helix domain-containing protein [Flammeovirga sp. MY04]MBB3699341.1 HTH-type transcriptional regulator/antitoxin HigA [Flammeovirga yaeyamensis]NMF35398.1 helix-turn-helix domain-containing protein [Flammeovirga yaeyamensis]QWG04258.1 helix-turn-helix domain-containing protein [Flammeovirga yaeyamensis]
MMTIEDKTQYETALKKLEKLMIEADDSIENNTENNTISSLAEAIDVYEYKNGMKMEEPSTLDYIKYKMSNNNITIKELSQLIGISPSRMGDFLNGKKKLTINIAVGIHNHLGISYDTIMSLANK